MPSARMRRRSSSAPANAKSDGEAMRLRPRQGKRGHGHDRRDIEQLRERELDQIAEELAERTGRLVVRIADRRKVGLHEPKNMRRERKRARRDRAGHGGRGQQAPAVFAHEQRRQHPDDQDQRVIFREQRSGQRKPEQRAVEQGRIAHRAQKRPGRPRPQREQHRIGVEPDGEEPVDRREFERHDGGEPARPFFEQADERPDAGIADRHDERREQEIGPVAPRHEFEPRRRDPGRERRVLMVAPFEFASPGICLGEVGGTGEIVVREPGIERPHRDMPEQENQETARFGSSVALREKDTSAERIEPLERACHQRAPISSGASKLHERWPSQCLFLGDPG